MQGSLNDTQWGSDGVCAWEKVTYKEVEIKIPDAVDHQSISNICFKSNAGLIFFSSEVHFVGHWFLCGKCGRYVLLKVLNITKHNTILFYSYDTVISVALKNH